MFADNGINAIFAAVKKTILLKLNYLVV